MSPSAKLYRGCIVKKLLKSKTYTGVPQNLEGQSSRAVAFKRKPRIIDRN